MFGTRLTTVPIVADRIATGRAGASNISGVDVTGLDDGTAVLSADGLQMRLVSDGGDWWIVTNSRTSQQVRTDDTDIVALLWFCAVNSHPPQVMCELVDPLTISVTVGSVEHRIEGETVDGVRQATLTFLEHAVRDLEEEHSQPQTGGTPDVDISAPQHRFRVGE